MSFGDDGSVKYGYKLGTGNQYSINEPDYSGAFLAGSMFIGIRGATCKLPHNIAFGPNAFTLDGYPSSVIALSFQVGKKNSQRTQPIAERVLH